MRLFGELKDGQTLKSGYSFSTFGSSVAVLFLIATGDPWDSVMDDAATVEGCSSVSSLASLGISQGSDCGSTAAVPFFICFTIIMSMILMNLFIAAIIENYGFYFQDVRPFLSEQMLLEWIASV